MTQASRQILVQETGTLSFSGAPQISIVLWTCDMSKSKLRSDQACFARDSYQLISPYSLTYSVSVGPLNGLVDLQRHCTNGILYPAIGGGLFEQEQVEQVWKALGTLLCRTPHQFAIIISLDATSSFQTLSAL